MAMSASKFVQLYDDGAITRHDAMTRLIQAAADFSPEVLAGELGADWLADLKSETASPPGRPEEIVWVESVCAGPGFDWEAHRAEMVRRVFAGALRWHQYFKGRHV
jgi:hypothetical protein